MNESLDALATHSGLRSPVSQQLLHAAASILKEIDHCGTALEIADGAEQPPMAIPASRLAAHFEIPAEEPRTSAGSRSRMHPGSVPDQPQCAVSSTTDMSGPN
ncbi:unnamed protein product [Lampetra fluviatilis]